MDTRFSNSTTVIKGPSVLPGLAIMAAVVIVGVVIFLLNSEAPSDFPYLYVVPYLLMLGVLLIIPLAYLAYRRRFRFDNPLIFGTLTYFLPAFVIGGMAYAFGFSNDVFTSLIQDPKENLPYTVWIIAIGFAGLVLGFLNPAGYWAGAKLSNYLPSRDLDPEKYQLAASILLIFGVINSVFSLMMGLFGFQRAAEIGSFDGLIYLSTLFWLQGSFILWYILFSKPKWNSGSTFIFILLIITSLIKAAFSGNRGSLLQIMIVVALAYVMAGRKFGPKQYVFAAILLIFGLIVGIIYGTTFRRLKGDEGQTDASQYTQNISATFDEIERSDNAAVLGSGLMMLAERFDTFSSVAIVVSNYEELAPYEESYGLDDNIYKDTTSFFIPRVIWPDKPVASDAHKYSDLYFNKDDNAFAITPMGDLLRNYGIWGIPIGMFFLGVLIRFTYRSLVEDQGQNLSRYSVYFMLLITLSYEGFFGTIIPTYFKVGFTAIVGVLIMWLIVRWQGYRPLQSAKAN